MGLEEWWHELFGYAGRGEQLNAVEIEEAISQLADQPFDPENFPYAFLEAFGNKDTTIKRLRAGASNKSDLGGVLQTNNIHIVTCGTGLAPKTLAALKQSPATVRAKAKFILVTDGLDLEAEDLASGETVACAYKDFPGHFGFFLPLAGISNVRQIAENAFDIRATSRLNRLYVELLKENPTWGTTERRHDLNHFLARLIFCFFAEDTGILYGTAIQQDRPFFSSPCRQSGLDENQPGHFRFDDSGGCGGRGTWRARHALYERTEHPESAQSAVPRRPAREAPGGGRQSPHPKKSSQQAALASRPGLPRTFPPKK